jgi:ferritin
MQPVIGDVMFKPEIEELLNKQIVKEIYSAHLYLSMSAWLNEKSLDGYATWYYVQYREEIDHALILFNFILNAGGRVKLGVIDAPPSEFEGVREILVQSYEHEQFVTQSIYDLSNAAAAAGDLKTVEFLKWFVNEQVEEEDDSSTNIGRYDILGKDSAGLYTLDRDMGLRTYTKTAYLADMEGAGA